MRDRERVERERERTSREENEKRGERVDSKEESD